MLKDTLLVTFGVIACLFVLVLLGTPGCASAGPPSDDAAAVTLGTPQPAAPDVLEAIPYTPADPDSPCSLTTEDELRAWAETHGIRCGTCVAIVCDGHPGPHICVPPCGQLGGPDLSSF